MTAVTLDQAIEVAMQLPLEQREMLLEIVSRRDIEARRQEIAQDAKESIAAYRSGAMKPQTADDIIASLRQDSEEGAEEVGCVAEIRAGVSQIRS